MEEEQEKMSGDGSGSNQETDGTDDHSVHLPAYLAYLSLGFKVITTVIIVLMAGWVIVTIRIIKHLHKVHNIYVAYMMAMNIMVVLTFTLFSSAMIIGYFTGAGDFIGCNVFIFMIYLKIVINFTFLVMSVDKVIAITLPLRHSEIMEPRVVCGITV